MPASTAGRRGDNVVCTDWQRDHYFQAIEPLVGRAKRIGIEFASRRVERGDILGLNCFPMEAGYCLALQRPLFAGTVDDTREPNAVYAEHGLLRYRSFGYGHSFGVPCHHYGREAGSSCARTATRSWNRAWWSRWSR